MRTSSHKKSLKVHIYPVGDDYYGSHPMSQWVYVLFADPWITDTGVRAYVQDTDLAVHKHHREDIFAMVPGMVERFKDVIIHRDPLG